VAYIVSAGCSDDSFDYFRAWLIANGRKRFEAAIDNPESVGDWAKGEMGYEDMMYVAIDAYEQKTGNDFPYDAVTSNCPDNPIGKEWGEDELETLYPQLCKKYF